jgi:rRNA-processing protein FCF1
MLNLTLSIKAKDGTEVALKIQEHIEDDINEGKNIEECLLRYFMQLETQIILTTSNLEEAQLCRSFTEINIWKGQFTVIINTPHYYNHQHIKDQRPGSVCKAIQFYLVDVIDDCKDGEKRINTKKLISAINSEIAKRIKDNKKIDSCNYDDSLENLVDKHLVESLSPKPEMS